MCFILTTHAIVQPLIPCSFPLFFSSGLVFWSSRAPPLQLLGVFHRFSNMKLIRTLSLLVALASAALADVEFLEPDAGATAKGGDTITVRWRDSGKEPKLSQLTRYDLYLCAGGDTADSYVS